MSLAARAARAVRVVTVLAAAGLMGACSGENGPSTPSDSGAVPVSPHGDPTPVDVCNLVSAGDTTRAFGRPLHPVNLEYGPAKVATLECGLGTTFGQPSLRVGLAIGPISSDVFAAAYGDSAGGDPQLVKRLGQAAIFRKEGGQLAVHVLVHSSILTVEAALDTARPIGKAALLDLAGEALASLPSNPVLASTNPGRRCSEVPVVAVTAGIGADPSLSGELAGQRGSVECSWTALPGSAVVTVYRSPKAVADFGDLARTAAYHSVDLPAPASAVQVMSRDDRAGDLLILTGSSAVVIDVMPTAGFSDREIPTTPGETTLASAVIKALT